MSLDSLTAACATVIAVASLVVSITEGRAARRHNRQSVRPLLTLECRRQVGGEIGIWLQNSGLGPAIVTRTSFLLDGNIVGPWEAQSVNPLRAAFHVRPRFTSLRPGRAVPATQSLALLAIDRYDPKRDVDFWDMVSRGIALEVQYESLYGGEKFLCAYKGPFDVGSPRIESETNAAPRKSPPSLRGLGGDDNAPIAPGVPRRERQVEDPDATTW